MSILHGFRLRDNRCARYHKQINNVKIASYSKNSLFYVISNDIILQTHKSALLYKTHRAFYERFEFPIKDALENTESTTNASNVARYGILPKSFQPKRFRFQSFQNGQ